MNEAEIRERVRQAVGDSRYPAGFASRVEARLNHSTLDQPRRTRLERRHKPWLVTLGRAGSLVGALLLLLLVASLVLGVHMWVMQTRPAVPATSVRQDLSVKYYQARLSVDQQRWQDTPLYTGCNSFGDANCVASSAPVIAALQLWLDDLDRSEPPAKFAALDALMRRDLAADISAQKAFNTAYEAKDVKATQAANAASFANETQFGYLARAIIASRQGTIVQYKAEVRLDREYLVACALCQQLVSTNQVSCPQGQTPTCLDQIAAVRTQVEIFMGHLVQLFAPDALSAKDAQLEADLVTADGDLDAIAAALSAGDQAALQTGHDALRQAVTQVESDATDIAGSN